MAEARGILPLSPLYRYTFVIYGAPAKAEGAMRFASFKNAIRWGLEMEQRLVLYKIFSFN